MTMNPSLRKKIAEKIIETMNMKEGQSVVIRSGYHVQDLVEEMALMSMKKGLNPSIATSTDIFSYKAMTETPVKYLKKSSKLSLKMVEAIDNWVSIEKMKDPRIMEKVPAERYAASSEGGEEFDKKFRKLKVKWCYVGYPTPENAHKLGISYNTLKKFIWEGMLVKKDYLVKNSAFVARALKGADYVHLTDEFGTDLRLAIRGRRINIDDGFISDEDVKNNDVGGNLPAGEVFIAPWENWGEGVLVSPKRTDSFTGKMIEDIRLVFRKGKVDLQKTTAEKNEKALKDTLKKSSEVDKKVYKESRAMNVAELGIGMNPVINRIIGYLLTDEKIKGTIHVAVGANEMYGGKSNSSLHWDFISNDRINMEVIYPSGKSRILMQKGKVVKN
jgi:aminopeptidase